MVSDQMEVLGIRNSILDRVLMYLLVCKLDTFWIDQVCIDQNNFAKKARAINSMDLVYKRARKSIGLLSSRISTSNEARILGSLLDGQLARREGPGSFRFFPAVSMKTITKTRRILQFLTEDDWWKRAWIYQEEYLSGVRMDLLIPVKSGVRIPFPYGRIPGEFCAQATKFREQATIFLLACLSEWPDCEVRGVLAVVEKYSLTLETSTGSLKTMSAKIFTDVARRGVGDAWDTLAISANACAYDIRLDSNALSRRGYSLSLSLLSQYLLNGEIMINTGAHDKLRHNSLDHTISGLLEILQPKFDSLPVSDKALTFLKHCRLPFVRFHSKGLKTEGYIWSLPKNANIDTSVFDLPKLSNKKRRYLESNPWDSLELPMLIDELSGRGATYLAAKLRHYLAKRRANATSPALLHLDIMACKLFQAIDCRLQLRCGHLPGKPSASIFIPQRWELAHSMHVLTTWQAPRSGKNAFGNVVSLKVSLRPDGVANPTRWINGVAFFSCNDISGVTIGWPRSWTRWPRKTHTIRDR